MDLTKNDVKRGKHDVVEGDFCVGLVKMRAKVRDLLFESLKKSTSKQEVKGNG